METADGRKAYLGSQFEGKVLQGREARAAGLQGVDCITPTVRNGKDAF